MAARRTTPDDEIKKRRERLAYVGALAAGLVHEIRTPLHAIQLNAQMLAEDVDKLPIEIKARFERRCKRVYSEVKSLSSTLDAFLTFARPPKLDPTPTDLNYFLRDLLDFIQPEMDEAEIIISAKLADDMYPVVIDQSQFTQVVLNLLRNAQEAIEARAEKEEEDFQKIIKVSTIEDEQKIKLVVEDNGIGINPEYEEKIFEVFFTTKPKGTGLGLGIVRRIIEDHHGDIKLEPTPPPGSKFTVTLPRGRFLEFKEH